MKALTNQGSKNPEILEYSGLTHWNPLELHHTTHRNILPLETQILMDISGLRLGSGLGLGDLF